MTATAPTETLQETFEVLVDRPGTPMSTAEVAAELGLERRSCYYRLDRLVAADLVESKQVGANGRVWWCPPDPDGVGTWADVEPLLSHQRDGEPAGVLVVDPTSTAVYANETLAVYFGVDRESLVGTDADSRRELLAASRTDRAVPPADGERFVVRGRDGTRRRLERREYPIASGRHEGGRLERYAVVPDAGEPAAPRTAIDGRETRLTALNELHGIVGEATEAAFEQSTRRDVEQVVCERLAAADAYQFAWVGAVDDQTSTVRVRAEAGTADYLDEVTISVDPTDERSRGPIGRALLTREVCVTNDVQSRPAHDPWREQVGAPGVASSAAIPIVYEGSLYGVLNVYAERPDGFEDEEVAVVSQLGEVIGHAIASIERKRALMSDDLVELVVHFPDIYESLDVPVSDDVITLDEVVPIGGQNFVQYGSCSRDAVPILDGLTAELEFWDDWKVLAERPDAVEFELRLSEPPALSRVASLGANVAGGTIEDGDFQLRIRLPYDAGVKEVIEVLKAEYPEARPVARRHVTRGATSEGRLYGALRDDLTARQQTVLEVAYRSGFFEWPRRGSTGDIAALLDITSSTFTEHIRKGERRLFEVLFGESEDANDRP